MNHGLKQVHSFPYYPHGNVCIEGFYNFHKTCLHKHVSKTSECGEVADLSHIAYNFLPNGYSKEKPSLLNVWRGHLNFNKIITT